MKQDKGQGTGLNILLSVVVSLFVIGLIVMIFSLMGTGMRDATYTSTSGTVTNESVHPTTSGTALSVSTYRNVGCTLTRVVNGSTNQVISSGNYTLTGCTLANTTSTFVAKDWNVSYTYTYDADNSATKVMNDTVTGISTVTNWFDLFIVISAMVVLIALTVLIIVAIRNSGMVNMGGSKTNNGVGTA